MKDIDFYNQTQDYLVKELSSFSQSDTKKLGENITKHSELYHELENPIISDIDYDMLLKKLEFLEEKFEIQVKISQKAWSEWKQSSFKKVAHSRPMISLDNTYNAEELRDFDTRIKRILRNKKAYWITPPVASDIPLNEGELHLPYTIEFKFDGLWIELIYSEGKLIRAITRGNGVEWEDVTENIMQITNIPKTIDKLWDFEVRWEVVMPISSFERLNALALDTGEKVFSNPRNAASGSLRVLDTSITKHRDLDYFAYDVSDFDEFSSPHSWILSPLGEKGTAYSNMIYYLQELGFSISSYFPKCFWIEQVIHAIENIWDIKSKIDFEIDGLVVKLDDISLWQEVWFTEHHPRYAIAYKFPAEIVTTKLESVEHSVGRTGTITPVANLTPVNIWGAIIRRATLHNYDEVEKLGVKIGDIVFLKRAWEVIPKIISVASSASETGLTGDRSPVISPPNHCPSCWNQVCKDEQKVRYYCPNVYGCPAQMQEKLAFAVGKQWFNIDWFGERQAGLFYRLDYITKFWDIFRLKDYKNEILLLDGFKEKSVQNLLAGIEKVRNTDIVTFLKALWIPGVGKKTAKTLGKYIEQMQPHLSLQERIERGIIWEGATEKLLQLPDIWPEVAESVIEFFTSQEDLVTDLLSELVIELPELAIGEWNQQWGRYTWKKVCITGSFEWYKREQLAELLELQGWEFMGSVSVKTDYLLAWDKAGSKLKKAQELWVKILSLEEFLA